MSAPVERGGGAVSARFARLALRLYPLAYQRRYGDEMRALLEDLPPRAGTVFDLLTGAARAHMRSADAPAGMVGPAERVRASTSGILLCWVFFATAGFGYYKTTEDPPFSNAGHAHPLLRDAHMAVQILALIATAAVVLGALPLIVSALAQVRREPGLWRRVALPALPVFVFVALSAVVIAIAHANDSPSSQPGGGSGLAIAWGIAGLACGTTCVLACRAALFATPVAPDRLRVALVAGTTVTGAMLAIAAATAVYAIALSIDASRVAGESNGPYQLLSVAASLILQVIVMVAAAALATIAVRRGWRVEGQLAGA
jgi:hypothetical protein